MLILHKQVSESLTKSILRDYRSRGIKVAAIPRGNLYDIVMLLVIV